MTCLRVQDGEGLLSREAAHAAYLAARAACCAAPPVQAALPGPVAATPAPAAAPAGAAAARPQPGTPAEEPAPARQTPQATPGPPQLSPGVPLDLHTGLQSDSDDGDGGLQDYPLPGVQACWHCSCQSSALGLLQAFCVQHSELQMCLPALSVLHGLSSAGADDNHMYSPLRSPSRHEMAVQTGASLAGPSLAPSLGTVLPYCIC